MTVQHPALDALADKAFHGFGDAIPKPRVMPGGFFQFEVANVDAAVALATLFRDAGRYQYFRGQADADWRVRSSFARQDPGDRQAAVAAICAFEAWVRQSPELVPYLKDENQIIAAAQHHGICATTFMDLTREPAVAGWFATDGARADANGALYLVDPERIQPIYDAFSSEKIVLRFIEIDVPNLWRLQAQSGLFLECTTDIDAIWPLDRIIFRQDGTQGRIERGRIYPEQRSHLEQMIDQHRLLEQRKKAMRTIFAGGACIRSKSRMRLTWPAQTSGRPCVPPSGRQDQTSGGKTSTPGQRLIDGPWKS